MKLVTLHYKHPLFGEQSASIPIEDDEVAYKYASALSALLPPQGCTDEYVTVKTFHRLEFDCNG